MINEQYRWQQFKEGAQQALADIFLSHLDDLFRYGLKLTGNKEMVKDCIQDLFLKLWKNRESLPAVQSVKAYLFRSLRNHLINSLSIQKPTISINNETDENLLVIYSHEEFLIHDQVTEENRHHVISALNKLTSRQREAIYLRYFDDLDFDTIAQVMEMNVQSVRNTISRGMICMRDLV